MNIFYAFPLLDLPSGGAKNLTLTHALGVVGNGIEIALLLAGAIAVIYIIWSGYLYITSFGNPEVTTRAKQTLTWAILGLLIALTASLIIYFLWNRFVGGELPTDAGQISLI